MLTSWFIPVFGGAGSPAEITITPTGGAVSGGSAAVKRGVKPAVAGGAVSAGVALYKIGRVHIPIGGGVSGGAATVINSDHLADTWTPEGGAVCGGTARCVTGHTPVYQWINNKWVYEFPQRAVMPIG